MIWLNLATLVLVLIGVCFMVLSSVGLLRLPDVYTRMHAGGKSSTLGIIALLLGVAVHRGDLLAVAKIIALIMFFFLTAPVAAHMLGRAAYLTQVKPVAQTYPDELEGYYEQKEDSLPAGKPVEENG